MERNLEPDMDECPVSFVFATCLKISFFLHLLFFTRTNKRKESRKRKRDRQRELKCRVSGKSEKPRAHFFFSPSRSFDSTAFLRIRQTFDSFTWEPRNSLARLLSVSLGVQIISVQIFCLPVSYHLLLLYYIFFSIISE